jgi:predicted PurR-regulated permease PerM
MDDYPTSVPPNDGGGWTRPRIIFLSVSSFLLVVLLVLVRQVLLPFILATLIAYVLTPLVAWCESRLRLPRSVSILSVYFLVFGVLTCGVMNIAPRLYDESMKLVSDVPRSAYQLAEKHGSALERWGAFLQNNSSKDAAPKEPAAYLKKGAHGLELEVGRGLLIKEEEEGLYRVLSAEPRTEPVSVQQLVDEGVDRFFRYAQINALHFLSVATSWITSLSRGLLLLFMTFMVAGYLMHTREAVLDFFRSFPPRRYQPGFDLLLQRVDRGLSGVVRGQLLICLVNGILSAVGFALFGLKYWPLLAVMAAVMSIIPIFGSILSSIPAVLIGLSQGFWTAFWVLTWILGIHQLEANFLNPKIIGVAAKIHPILVVFSLLVGEHFFGLWGALLAVPILSQSVFNHFRFGLPDVEPDSLVLNPRRRSTR